MDILRALRDCVYEWDYVADTATFSEELRERFGYQELSVTGASQWWMDRIHPDDRDRTDTGATLALRARHERISLEYRFRRADGGWVHVLDRVRIHYDADGKPLRCVGSLADVTDVRRVEERIRQSQKLESIGRLAGGVAHDFNNLLTAILGSSDLLTRRLSEDDPARREIEEIRVAAMRASALTRQLLAFSRNQPVESRVVDLNDVTAGMETILRRLTGEDIHLSTSLAPDLVPVKVEPGRIEQALMNLVVNARDAMPGGGQLTISTANAFLDPIEARERVDAAPGSYATLSVSDTGCGMDEGVLAHLFEPFFTTKAEGRGTGLGLATVYGIARQAGGHVTVRSEPGRGSTFTIHLPAAEGRAEPSPAHQAPVAATGRAGTVLLVEDDDSVRKVLVRNLRAHGHDVLEARDGAEALAVAERYEGAIHALLTDVVMPGMGGALLAERLVAARPGMGVLFMSGYADVATAAPSVADGRRFLQKPFEMDDLVAALGKVLRAATPCPTPPGTALL